MTKTIRAKYANGVITPLEPLDLPDGTVVLLTVEELPADEPESLKDSQCRRAAHRPVRPQSAEKAAG